MHKTAWTKGTSSVPSDRIRPVHQQLPTNSKNKGKQPASEPPKSKEVRQLETLLRALQDSSREDKDPKGGCFCQARQHELSAYSPLCNTCGLVLCSINLPQYSCPHCSTPVVTAAVRDSLIVKLESQISETIAREIQERERKLEEARQAAGAFPTLTGPTGKLSSVPATPNMNQTHKILSLNSKTKKLTVSSYATTPASSRPSSRAESESEEPLRIPPPPTEVIYSKRRIDRSNPWENINDKSYEYIPLARVDGQHHGNSKNIVKSKKGKGKENN